MKALILFAAICLVLMGCKTGTKNTDNKLVNAADLELHLAEKDYTLLYFWTTWCGPCRKAFKETLPVVEKVVDGRKAQLITIAVSKDDEKITEISEVAGLQAKKLRLDFIGPDLYLNHKIVLKNTLEDIFKEQKVWRNSVPVFVLVNKAGQVINAGLPKDIGQLIAILDELGIVNDREKAVIGNKENK